MIGSSSVQIALTVTSTCGWKKWRAHTYFHSHFPHSAPLSKVLNSSSICTPRHPRSEVSNPDSRGSLFCIVLIFASFSTPDWNKWVTGRLLLNLMTYWVANWIISINQVCWSNETAKTDRTRSHKDKVWRPSALMAVPCSTHVGCCARRGIQRKNNCQTFSWAWFLWWLVKKETAETNKPTKKIQF